MAKVAAMTLAETYEHGLAAHRAGRLDEAERAYLEVVAQVDHLPSLHNLGVICDARGRFLEAGQWYRRAAEAAPQSAKRQEALGIHLRTVRDWDAAEAAYRRALALDPASQAAVDLAFVLLAQGRYPEGWSFYESRARRAKMAKRFGTPEWQGEPLAGKRLLIWREEGFGDQMMMARFLPQLAADSVVYVGAGALQRLFAPFGMDYAVYDAGEAPRPEHDVWMLSMSLPHRVGMTAEGLSGTPYLFAEPRRSAGRIGVVTQGQAANRNNAFRSLPGAAAARLMALPGAIGLDPAETGARDFRDTAEIIMGLDLVITVDTSVAHLAGALGRPVWVMLAAHALDWHWPRAGRSAWYDSARLFCQETPGDWDGVVERVIAALAEAKIDG
ncbi:tetratricopeptide repeat protein [Phenylobacterium sp.]|jgi:tetratricopeptide (TPR) repeat protein|uniref:tetratricopeptide repeat protein n=1 Tax=Phenylobacterium sp. TaxID=1871053 RepID=UPI002F3E75D9